MGGTKPGRNYTQREGTRKGAAKGAVERGVKETGPNSHTAVPLACQVGLSASQIFVPSCRVSHKWVEGNYRGATTALGHISMTARESDGMAAGKDAGEEEMADE